MVTLGEDILHSSSQGLLGQTYVNQKTSTQKMILKWLLMGETGEQTQHGHCSGLPRDRALQLSRDMPDHLMVTLGVEIVLLLLQSPETECFELVMVVHSTVMLGTDYTFTIYSYYGLDMYVYICNLKCSLKKENNICFV